MFFRISIVALAIGSGCSSEPSTPPAAETGLAADTAVDDVARDTAVDDDAAGDTAKDDAPLETGSDAATPDSMGDDGSEAGDAPDPCDTPAACPAATASDKSQLCGRIYDLGTTVRVTGAAATALELTVYDVITLAETTATTRPSPLGVIAVDACGRFSATVTRPTFGFFGLAVDDKAGATDAHVSTLITASAAAKVDNLRAFATKTTTDAAWSTAAGITSTFAARGTTVFIFVNSASPIVEPFPGGPTAGVTIIRPATGSDVLLDYYFSDTAALSRATVDPAKSATGANGTGLLLESSTLTNHSGTGGLTGSCSWNSVTAGLNAKDMLVVHEVPQGC